MSSNMNTTFHNAGTQTNGSIHEQSGNAGSSRSNAETLLRTLRNVFDRLVHPAEREYDYDVNESELGSDGEEFITALQKFMISSLRSQWGPVGRVEVDLSEIPSMRNDYDSFEEDFYEPEVVLETEPPASSLPYDNHGPVDITDGPMDTESPPEQFVGFHGICDMSGLIPGGSDKEAHDTEQAVESYLPIGNVIGNRGYVNVGDKLNQRRLQFLEKLLKRLQEHIFNTMPIRLLHFKPVASKLQITLIERAQIYSRIALDVETNMNFESVSQQIIDWQIIDDCPEQEAEELTIRELISKYSRYAILSHTWSRGPSGEVTYSNWNRGEFDAQLPGSQKLMNFCKAAWEDHGVFFGWMDTVCINKESSAELDESIRSMYKWYSHAHVCITYLAETVILSDMHNDTWFTRGWTLQELIAPAHIKFYNTYWIKLGNSLQTDKKASIILAQIEQATTITASELTAPIARASISRRMQMAARRQVTREEDSIYALMGIFNVSITTAYGEGARRALCRLLKEILTSLDGIVDMFNWAGLYGSRLTKLVPSTLQGYLHRSSNEELKNWMKPIEPLLLTHLGLRVTIVLMPAILIQNLTSRHDSFGDYHATADISILVSYLFLMSNTEDNLARGSYSILDARISEKDGWNRERNYQLTLGVLNVGAGEDRKIIIPKNCLAVGLRYDKGSAEKIPTETPIVFSLNKTSVTDENEIARNNDREDCYYIERSELVSHGMKLATLYL